ncbi:CsgG/HfaB family protein [Parendozoicomonas haliclonae]|uniref:Curli production assembly/transport component CsgG n=1 Tax=Parendozoicomonas haliclonae TaxID=1960125 RepID=A0A1X7AKT2_9GAMM|nr:CsgG/HfaB family protein [Parendozoicomonas haliclonae]SMA48331.1 Curli production assembly/transport component CsgG [Parendozoicomonas haliclonae]
MKYFKGILLAAALLPAIAGAAIVQVQVKGTGLSEDTAVESALVQALRQVHGMDIKSVQQSSQFQQKADGKATTEVNVNRQSRIEAGGQIAGYDIIDSQCGADGCTASLNVRVHKYEVPGLAGDKRRRIAVLPFTGGKEFRKLVASQVQEQLVQSRRFAVLDREQEEAYNAEKSLWQSGDVPLAEKARLGKVLGLDYIVTGSIEKAGVHRWADNVALTGEREDHVRTYATVRYQIIAIASRQVKWSDTVTVSLTGVDNLEQGAVVTGGKIAQELLDNIYPMRVVSSSNGEIILNQGGKTVKVGSHYHIYALGEMIVDPYTKEPLGQSETKIATVKVVRVHPKMSYATLVMGDLNSIQNGFIARSGRAPHSASGKEKPVKSNVVVPESGGVIL